MRQRSENQAFFLNEVRPASMVSVNQGMLRACR
jgi:hypothetical protein